MTPDNLLADLSSRGVIVAIAGDDIKLRGPAGSLTEDDVVVLRSHKPDVLRRLRLAEGLPIDDHAARLLEMEDVDPTDVPTCSQCGQLCDVQTVDDAWHCTPCDPLADARRLRTERLIRQAESIRCYDGRRNG